MKRDRVISRICWIHDSFLIYTRNEVVNKLTDFRSFHWYFLFVYTVSQVIQQSHLIWITLMLWDGRHSCFGIQSVLYFPGLFLLCPLPPHLRHRQFHASSRNILCVGYNVECYLDVQFTSKQWCKWRGLFPLAWVNQWVTSFWQRRQQKLPCLFLVFFFDDRGT